MDGGEGGRQLRDGLTSGSRGTSLGRNRIRGGGSTARISKGREVRLTSSQDETVARSVFQPAGSGLTQQSVGLHSGAVHVSVVSVDVNRRRVDRPVSAVPDSIDVNDVLHLDRWTHVEWHPSARGVGDDWCGLWCFYGRRAGFCVPGWC